MCLAATGGRGQSRGADAEQMGLPVRCADFSTVHTRRRKLLESRLEFSAGAGGRKDARVSRPDFGPLACSWERLRDLGRFAVQPLRGP